MKVAVKASFPDDVLLTDDPKVLYSRLCRYVSNTAHCDKWALNNFESRRSQVAVKESFLGDVLFTDVLKLLCSCLCKYVSNTARYNKWALNNFKSCQSRVAVEESFPNNVFSTDNPKSTLFLPLCIKEMRKANGWPYPPILL